MEPDRKLCKFCGVELPFYLGFGEDLCPRCLSRLALRGRRVEMEEACVQRDRAERAEDEVKRLETLTRRMRNSIDRSIAELYNIPEARTAIRLLERTYAESSDPCLNCDTKHIISSMEKEIAAQHIALNKAVSFICGCPPFGQRVEPCKLMQDPPGQCAECWTSHLLEQARTRMEAKE